MFNKLHIFYQFFVLELSSTCFLLIQVKCYGAELLRQVAERINLLEVDYFDLEYLNEEKNPVGFSKVKYASCNCTVPLVLYYSFSVGLTTKSHS